MIRYLLVHGADPTLSSSGGKYTILHRFAQYATSPCMSLIIDHAPTSILLPSRSADVVFHATTAHAADINRIPMITYLLDRGAPIDMVAGCGTYEDEEAHFIDLLVMGRKTALHWAVEHGMVDVVRLLLERGADVEKKTWSLATGRKWVSVGKLAEMCGQGEVG
jgi:ankyrin repeat protein